MIKIILTIVGLIVGGLIFAWAQRKFSSETLANGFMDKEKGEGIAPTVFPKKKKSSNSNSKKWFFLYIIYN